MGFLDKIFGKKEVEEEIQEISLEEAQRLCNEKIGKLNYEEVRESCEGIKENINLALQALGELKKAQLDKEINKRLYNATEQSRKHFIANMKKELHNIKLRDKYDYYLIQELNESLSKSLKNIAEGNRKHSYYISLSFRKEMQNLGKIIKDLNDHRLELENYLEPITKKNQLYQALLDEIKNKENLEKETKNLEEHLGKLKKEDSMSQKELVKLREKRVIDYNKQEKDLQEFEKERKEIESKIFSMIDVFSRAFRKYEKVGFFEKPIAIMINKYLEEPVKTALEDTEEVLVKILDGIEKSLVEKKLGLKENVNKKALSMIQKIREGELKKLVLEHEEIEKKIEEKKEELEPLVKEAEKQQSILKNKTSKAEELSSKVKEIEERIQLKKQELEKNKENLKHKVKALPGNMVLKSN